MLRFRRLEDPIILARHDIVWRHVPFVAIAVVTAKTTELVGLGNARDVRLPTLITVVLTQIICAYALAAWVRRRHTPPHPSWILRELRVLSALLIVGGVLDMLSKFDLIRISDGPQRLYLLVQMVLAMVCLPVVGLPLGQAAYIYAGIAFLGSSVGILISGISFAAPLIFVALVYLVVIMLAMTCYLRKFESAVRMSEDLKVVSDQNMRLASLDSLTGLSNRRHFFAALDTLCQTAMGSDGRVALGVIDLDRFKPVNDSYGHIVGDLVLKSVATRLEGELPAGVALYRLGGDEFAFTLDAAFDDGSLSKLGRMIVELVERPMRIDDLVIVVSCSIGIAVCPDLAANGHELYEHADAALYESKRAGRGQVTLFSEAMLAAVSGQRLMEQMLRRSNRDAEFWPVFQPIVNARNGRVVAFECLARWNCSILGAVPPGKFIPVAERIGLVTPITLVILRKAIAAMRTWPPGVRLSFNLSVHDVMSAHTVQRIIGDIKESGLALERFCFEITETALLQDFTIARANIMQLRASGASVALDDFGTGYSSLSHVQSLPLDKLKIDRRFVQDLPSNVTNQTIVRSLIALCSGLGIGCVAEGAETEAEVHLLQTLGCEEVQGFYFARPMANADALAYLTAEATDQRRTA